MITIKSKIQTLIKVPGEFFRYRNEKLRKFYHYFSRFLHFRTNYLRSVSRNIDLNEINLKDIIDNKIGYKKYDKETLKKWNINVDQLIENIKKKITNINLDQLKKKDENIVKLFSSQDYKSSSEEFKFVLNKHLIKIISQYLNCVPLLTHISLWYSPNLKIHEDSSQFYHLDHEDYKQIKGFLYIYDVDDYSGPLNVIGAEQSCVIQKKINYKLNKKSKRVCDKTIQTLKKELKIDEVIMNGKSGDLILIDTSNCFHFGSRLANKPRYVLAFQYITPYAFVINWNWQNYKKLYHKYCENFDTKLIKKITGKII